MAIINISRYVKRSELPMPADATAPLPSTLVNYGGPEFELDECKADEVESKGTVLDMRNFDGCVQAGHLYFHPGTRKPPIPPAAVLEAFANDHPELPIVTESDRFVEVPHLVLARFIKGAPDINTGDVPVAVDKDGCAIIFLFTVAADNLGRCFDPSTHFKMGKQHNGVKIFDWDAVNFDSWVGSSPRAAWLALYGRLLTMV